MDETESNRDQLEAQLAGFARIGAMENYPTAYPRRMDERIDALVEREAEGVLSIERTRRLDIVLCTGGPHVEVQWHENDRMEAVGFGWFGAGEVRRVLTDDERAGLTRSLGLDDFDETWEAVDR